ncbi:MAG: DUF3472 domain-containing protein [Verrucomicrobiales bacterium]
MITSSSFHRNIAAVSSLLLVLVAGSSSASAEPLRVSASTAYLDPDVNGARVSAERGISRWKDPALAVKWFGELKHPGELDAKIEFVLAEGEELDLKLTVAGQSRRVTARGAGDQVATADFGTYKIAGPGYQSFVLESTAPAGEIRALVLGGAAVKDAHFNLKPRRNAASVHLSYPVERGTEVSAFYCEMTGVEDPLWTYYMACGWHRGYFGMQVNSPTERRIIFSVWDSGGEAVDRKKVADDDRVQLVAKGEGVYSGDFGNEGTGGHSHLKFNWKTGERQRFLVTAEPVGTTHTVFAGYYFHPEKNEWMLISSWRAPKEGKFLRGLYSFSENFIGRNGHLVRKALFGNQWLRTSDGEWREITTAGFSHDVTGKADRFDRSMGLADDGQFYLMHGGFIDGAYTEYGKRFTRPESGRSPAEMSLPPLPEPKGKDDAEGR